MSIVVGPVRFRWVTSGANSGGTAGALLPGAGSGCNYRPLRATIPPSRSDVPLTRPARVSNRSAKLSFGDLIIGRRRFYSPQRDTGKRLRINHQITISPVRLIGENDEQIGVIPLEDAIGRAIAAEADLVEVAPQATPPVCRIMDYGKWKYQQRKKEQKARSHAKQSELKEVRLRPKIDDHDLLIKLGKAREFLIDGDKVQFTMLFRGREMAHRDLGLKMMNEIRDALADLSKVETVPRQSGRRMTMVLAPDRSGAGKSASPPPAAPRAAPPPPESRRAGTPEAPPEAKSAAPPATTTAAAPEPATNDAD